MAHLPVVIVGNNSGVAITAYLDMHDLPLNGVSVVGWHREGQF